MTTEKNTLRDDYVSGICTHRQYYSAILETAGMTWDAIPREIIEQARVSNDEHLNDVDVTIIESFFLEWKPYLKHAFTMHGDAWSMSGHVCAVKEALKQITGNN